MIKKVSLIAINTATDKPSLVIVSFHKETNGSPGVRNRLKTTVNIKRNKIAFIPLTINLNGTLDNLITIAKNKAAKI